MNIPKTKIDDAKTVMAVGIGGGFDVFTALPFSYHWPDKEFIFVNSSPSGSFHFRQSTTEDYPESFLKGYSVGRHGTILLKKAYENIAERADVILAVDGGVDSLQTGDEDHAGTILEDFISLAALDDVKKDKVLCCAGFGTETEENLNHYRVLENMSSLPLIGSFSLTKDMERYKQTCETVWVGKRKSHVQTKIISSVEGRFGNDNIYKDVDARVYESTGETFCSVLSGIFWMFDFDGVVKRNKVINLLKKGNTFIDCKIILREFLANCGKRSKKIIPL